MKDALQSKLCAIQSRNDRRTVLLAHGAGKHALVSIASIVSTRSSTLGAFVRRQRFHVCQEIIAHHLALDLRDEVNTSKT